LSSKRVVPPRILTPRAVGAGQHEIGVGAGQGAGRWPPRNQATTAAGAGPRKNQRSSAVRSIARAAADRYPPAGCSSAACSSAARAGRGPAPCRAPRTLPMSSSKVGPGSAPGWEKIRIPSRKAHECGDRRDPGHGRQFRLRLGGRFLPNTMSVVPARRVLEHGGRKLAAGATPRSPPVHQHDVVVVDGVVEAVLLVIS